MFDAEKVKNDLVLWIRDWFDTNGRGCCAVLGISGGKDSSVAAALMKEALGAERTVGVMMPNGVQPDIDMSQLLVSHLGIRRYTVNIAGAYAGVLDGLAAAGIAPSRQTTVNLPPRLRMSVLYAVSQSLNGRVINTCNYSEDYVGYSTRYGDMAGDMSPLGRLCVREVKALGRVLGLPEALVEKAPSDGLTGRTDEDNLGFTYAALDGYIRDGIEPEAEVKARIDRLHRMNAFKLLPMPVFPYEP